MHRAFLSRILLGQARDPWYLQASHHWIARGRLRGIGRDRQWAEASAAGSPARCCGRVRGVGAGAVGIGCAVRGRSGRCCTFDRDPPLEDPQNHAETSRRSTLLKFSHVQTDLLCTWESADARSTIRENRGILRKTRNRPAGPSLSHVQSARPTGPGEGPRRPGVAARPIRAARACPGARRPRGVRRPAGAGTPPRGPVRRRPR